MVFRKNKVSQDLSQKHRVGNSNNLMYSSLLFIGALTSLQTYFCSPVTNLGRKKAQQQLPQIPVTFLVKNKMKVAQNPDPHLAETKQDSTAVTQTTNYTKWDSGPKKS